MPSKLTCNIYNGTDMSLRGFALKCVAQLGAGYWATNQINTFIKIKEQHDR